MTTFFAGFWILFAVALLCSSMGFKRYIWFISIGYGFAVAGIGLASFFVFHASLDAGTVVLCLLLLAYGCRLGGYLTYREFRMASYNKNMKGEIKEGTGMNIFIKIAMWLLCALLYLCETAPIIYRLHNGISSTVITWIGAAIMVLGLTVESLADIQKSKAKKIDSHRWVDTGLFSFVRCPNYLGEMLFWTGTFVSGVTALKTPMQWILALLGYIGIIYIMFSGARRLEIRQNKRYGSNPDYQAYVKKTPIMVPFIPLYSVEKYKWLVG